MREKTGAAYADRMGRFFFTIETKGVVNPHLVPIFEQRILN